MTREDISVIIEKRVGNNLRELQEEHWRSLNHVEYDAINRILLDLDFVQRSLKGEF